VHNFAVTGVGGFVAPRHLKAITATGNRVIAAVDPHDAVGILDQYSFDVRFFTEFERFDRHLEKLRRGPAEARVHYLSVCSPNYLHDAHVRLALRIGADAICEKPLVINPWNLDTLQELERETGRRVFTVLQLRVHPVLVELKKRLDAATDRIHDVELTYITARGRWYETSWKGSEERSGGLVLNIGIHFRHADSGIQNPFPALGGTTRLTAWDVPVGFSFTKGGWLQSADRPLVREDAHLAIDLAHRAG